MGSHIKIKHISGYITVIVSLTVIFVFCMSCEKPKPEVVKGFKDAALIPSLRSVDVSTLISDSGITRYRIISKEWLMYENAKRPYWFFPKGIYVEKFDSLFHVEAYIKGDTAIFYKDDQLWELKGNVEMENIKGEFFSTSQLFWNQRQQKIYSDRFIHIEKMDKIIEGTGFMSNEPMTKYEILHTQGIFPMKSEPSTRVSDSVPPYNVTNNAQRFVPVKNKKGGGQ